MRKLFEENVHAQHDIAILAIGNVGVEAVRKHRYPTYGKKQSPIRILKVTGTSNEQYQQILKTRILDDIVCCGNGFGKTVFEVIMQTEILFVVADPTEKLVYDIVRYCTNSRRNNIDENKYTVLVDCSLEKHQNDALSSWSDLVISNRNPEKAYCPIKMLLSDMQTQFVGIDSADVKRFLEVTPKLSYLEERVDENTKLEASVVHLERIIYEEKRTDDIFHALLYVVIPRSLDLGVLDRIYKMLSESVINGDIIFQVGFHTDENDCSIQIALLYGRETVA